MPSSDRAFLRRSGQAILLSVAQELVFPTMTDPITGDKIKESDIIKLRSAGSGFAAKGAKESEVYRPALAC